MRSASCCWNRVLEHCTAEQPNMSGVSHQTMIPDRASLLPVVHARVGTPSSWLCSCAVRFALVGCASVQAAGISQQGAGRVGNLSERGVTQATSSVSVDPADMTLEEYRMVSGGALPPVYSLAAAAVGAAILILTIIVVGLITVIRNRFCSKLLETQRRNRENSIDQSKASTSSTARPMGLKQKKSDKTSGVQYQPIATKDKAEVTFEMTSRRWKKSDLEQKSGRSSTSVDSVTPKDQYLSTRSLPVFET